MCVKPNEVNEGNRYDRELVKTQIKSLGLEFCSSDRRSMDPNASQQQQTQSVISML
jgi:predicted fused transcriptional regulator/phosphomethylpyrimidine kinase